MPSEVFLGRDLIHTRPSYAEVKPAGRLIRACVICPASPGSGGVNLLRPRRDLLDHWWRS